VDWNNDGMKDLILGEYNGNVRIYLNTNTDADPVFNGFTLLQMGGSAFDCGNYSMPHILDWDNDGRKDMICGESNGKIWLLLNEGTNANPVFNSAKYLQAGAGNLTVGYRSAPTVTDWDGDGKKDILSGDVNGNIYFFKNTGADAAPAFSYKLKLKIGNNVLDVGHSSRPDLVDWDNDGALDLICGEYSGTLTCYPVHGPLALSHNEISQATGGAVDFKLNAGVKERNRNYLILGSLSGAEPGFPLPGGMVTLPLNWDGLTSLSFTYGNTSIFPNFQGTLDGSGIGSATLDTLSPLPPGAVGATLYFAYLLYPPFDFVSNPVAIEIVQ